MQIRHEVQWIASVVQIKHILCDERHNADLHIWNWGGYGQLRHLWLQLHIEDPRNARARSVDVSEQIIWQAWGANQGHSNHLYLGCHHNKRPIYSFDLHWMHKINVIWMSVVKGRIRITCAWDFSVVVYFQLVFLMLLFGHKWGGSHCCLSVFPTRIKKMFE